MTRHISFTPLLLSASILALAGGLPGLAQVAGGTAQLSTQGHDITDYLEDGLIYGGDQATRADLGKALEELQDSRLFQGQSDKIQNSIDYYTQRANDPSLKRAVQKDAAKNIKRLKLTDRLAAADKKVSLLEGARNMLNLMDFVSTAAKAAGHFAEGDSTGAAGVIAQDVTKKLSEGAGAAAGGFLPVPGSSAFGAYAGNKLYQDKIAPVVAKREQEVRDQEYRDRYLGKPWLRPVEVMDKDGKTRVLDDDLYVEKGTGVIKRRSPEAQKAFETHAKQVWKERQALGALHEQLRNGEISQERYDKMFADYAAHDRFAQWDPEGAAARIDAAEEMRKQAEDMANGEETEATEGPGKSLDEIAVRKVRASIVEESEIGTAIIGFEFYNVGALEEGYGAAAVHIQFKQLWPEETVINSTTTGTYSGGPNGVLSFTFDGTEVSCQVSGGRTITCQGTSGAISDPSAFANWP
ncbi:hypothetical protein [Celeribacter neptunius]|uniref:Uncharacterized protein n=1 Tax=Celeribacter neptunius TaxID=588602 RepID=A0A1I3L7W6_9RHOB|nr:hypothetical protein [Celeribacter neptunius]SFI80821.1 hypothetical protein SAMN04487991_0924 [Celeribacter neptunius]